MRFNIKYTENPHDANWQGIYEYGMSLANSFFGSSLSDADKKDAVSKAIERILKYWHSYNNDKSKFTTYLYTIFISTFKNYIRDMNLYNKKFKNQLDFDNI